ncbi:MAG: hypothetical protein Q9187_005532 [Circinaria calcarea]
MAPTKKSKKTADSINSRLALVMKSGKGKTPKWLDLRQICSTMAVLDAGDSDILSGATA